MNAIPSNPTFPALALQLAEQALLLSNPNPAVGCVLQSPDGQPLGTGHTQARGQAHAEVMALRDATARGNDVRGATAYVTLEPCAHHGRTPPCCDALISAGVARVVVALQDPNPLVAGQGLARLRAAGVAVEVLPSDHPAALHTRELNLGFLSRMVRKVPWVRMKAAASLDGKTALPDGQSQWITGEAARADGHAWRARASAVLTGIGTVLQDNPRLDVRAVPTPRQPHLVLVDSRLETPLDAALWNIDARQVWIYVALNDAAAQQRALAFTQRGATVVCLPGQDAAGQPTGKVDLGAMLRDLATREVNELHVEAGHKLNGSLLREDLVDELLLYLAPKLLGSGADLAQWPAPQSLALARTLRFHEVAPLGPDLRIRARVSGHEAAF